MKKQKSSYFLSKGDRCLLVRRIKTSSGVFKWSSDTIYDLHGQMKQLLGAASVTEIVEAAGFAGSGLLSFNDGTIRFKPGQKDSGELFTADGVESAFIDYLKAQGITITIPMGVGDVLGRIAQQLQDEIWEFKMNLIDHNNHSEKREYKFRIHTIAMGQSVSENIGHRDDGTSIYSYTLQAHGDKFEYLDYKDGKVVFGKLKDVNGAAELQAFQYTKASKVIRDLITPAHVEVFSQKSGGEEYRVFNGGDYLGWKYEYVQGLERWYIEGQRGGISIDVIKEIVGKGLDRMYELAAAELKPTQYDIKVTSNIEKIYRTETSHRKTGTLGSSCMAAHNYDSYVCAKQSDLYDYLPGVKIIYATAQDGKLIGRALLWENMEFTESKRKFTFLDRIYGTEEFIKAAKEWAAEKGYWWKVVQSFSDNTIRNANGDKETMFVTPTMKLPKGKIDRQIPYFDSMKYARVLSKSKAYATIQLASYEKDGFDVIQTTKGYPMVKVCSKCGKILTRSDVRDSVVKQKKPLVYHEENVCKYCSIPYQGNWFEKSDHDVRLSFSSSGVKLVPAIVADERVAEVEVSGKKVIFDVTDYEGIERYFKQFTKAKKAPKPKPARKKQASRRPMADDTAEHLDEFYNYVMHEIPSAQEAAAEPEATELPY
jgi:hypothetical protein